MVRSLAKIIWVEKENYIEGQGPFKSGNGSTFVYTGQIPGEKIERMSLRVICGEMVVKLATISDCIFEDKRWTEPKKYGKISIRKEALKSGADGG